jgi:hypothetical protein
MPGSNNSHLTILDVDHPRSRALQQRALHLNALWDRLDPDQQHNDELQQLHRDIQARMVTLLANGLNLEEHEDLERQCALYGAYLHDETNRAGLEGIRTLVQQTEEELKEWAGTRIKLHRDFIDGLRDRMTDVAQRLNSLTDPDNGTIRRTRRNIRELQERVAALQDENDGFHALRDEMATMRRDIDELRQQAGARPHEGEIPPQNQAPPMGHQDPIPPAQDPAPPAQDPAPPRRQPSPAVAAAPRRLLEIQQPAAFSGGSSKIPFDIWWEEVRQYLKAQPADVIGSAERKIVWASGLLQDDAKSWYWDWVKRANEGEVQYDWETFENDLIDRFQEDEQDVRALRNLEKLSYKEGDSIHSFLAKWDALSLKARVKDVVYRQMLLGAMPRAVIERLQLNEPAKDDRGFRDQVLRAGKTSEHWHHHRLADRPRVTTSRPEPSRQPATPVRNSGPSRNLGPSRYAPQATTAEKRYPQLFATVEDATKGVPPHVVRWRVERGHCGRCGWSTPIGKHLATHCTREPNSRLPQPPQNAVAGNRVAAIELGKRERPIEIDEFDDGWKRPRAEDSIAWEPELPPLYSNEAASDSEEKFED